LKPGAGDVVSLNPRQSMLLNFVIHVFSPLAFSAPRWCAQAASFSVGVVWRGAPFHKNVGGTAALGPATRLLGSTGIGRGRENRQR